MLTGKKRKKILRMAVLSTATLLLCSPWSFDAYAADESAPMNRPGAKNDAGVVNVTSPDAYPDLMPCIPKLRDPLNYRGSKRKILRQIEPGKDGWLFRTADFRTDFSMPDKTFNDMLALNNELKKKGVDLYVIIQPSRAMLMHKYILPGYEPEGYDPEVARQNFKGLIKRLNDAGIHTVDLSDIPDDLIYFFKGDPHWRREGAKWSAKQVAKMVEQNPKFKDIPTEKFASEITWWLESEKGEFDEFVEDICDVTRPPERRPMWATTSLSGVSANSLFGEVKYPEIAIIGTSNTAHEEDFNFVGSLKEAMNVDIRNRAVSAGGFSGAGILFFSSNEFHEHPPKILLWEFLAHHDFNDYVGFRQMLPAIEGPCSDKDALAISDDLVLNVPKEERKPNMPAMLPLKKGVFGPPSPINPKARVPKKMYEKVFIDHLEDKHIRARDSYLQIDVTDPEDRELRISTLYANGDADTIDVTRSRRAKNPGRYYIDFNPDIDQELMLMQIETDKPVGKIKARICPIKRNL